MNLPNKITTARLALTAAFVVVMSFPVPQKATVALWLFIIAAITDYYDGMLARKYGLVTNFGKLMDPLVDKILICAAFILLCAHDLLPPWLVILVMAREFLVTGLRSVASSRGTVLAADRWGKWKTGFQIATAIYFFLVLAVEETGMAWFEPVMRWPGFKQNQLGLAFWVLALVFTLLSGWNYLWRNREIVLET